MPAARKSARKRPARQSRETASPETLAEALVLRANAQRRLAQLKERLLRNAKVQEGENPAEDPALLMREVEDVSSQLVSLIQRINRTNSSTTLADGMTIADAIAVRDVLRLRHAIYRELATAATITQGRTTRSEVRFRPTVSVSEIQRTADDIARDHRLLDTRIQAANWASELKE